MGRLIFAGLVLLSGAIPVSSQDQAACPARYSEIPTLRRFRLGMTEQQFREAYPTLHLSSSTESGYNRVEFHPNQLAKIDKSLFENIDRIDVAFLDSKIVQISVTYVKSFRMENFQALTSAVSRGLNLPEKWHFAGENFNWLACADFSARLMVVKNAYFLMIESTSFGPDLTKRYKELEEKKKMTSNP